MRNKWAYVVQVPFVALIWSACSNDNTTPGDGGDATAKDVVPDKKAPPDTGSGNDSGDAGTCASGTTCEVCDMKYTPPQMAKPYAYPGLCSNADIAAYIAACGYNGTQTACTNWGTAEQTSAPNCYNCVGSAPTDPSWGALMCDNSLPFCVTNTGGCIDVVTNKVSLEKQAGGTGSCGDLVDAYLACTTYACGNCSSSTDYNSCIGTANLNECKSDYDAYQSSTGACGFLAGDAGALVNACFANNDADFTTEVAIMCGGMGDGGVSDAASDAPVDAPTDAVVTDASADAPDGD